MTDWMEQRRLEAQREERAWDELTEMGAEKIGALLRGGASCWMSSEGFEIEDLGWAYEVILDREFATLVWGTWRVTAAPYTRDQLVHAAKAAGPSGVVEIAGDARDYRWIIHREAARSGLPLSDILQAAGIPLETRAVGDGKPYTHGLPWEVPEPGAYPLTYRIMRSTWWGPEGGPEVDRLEAHVVGEATLTVTQGEVYVVREIADYGYGPTPEQLEAETPWEKAYMWRLEALRTETHTSPSGKEVTRTRRHLVEAQSRPETVRELVASGRWPEGEIVRVVGRDPDAWFGA